MVLKSLAENLISRSPIISYGKIGYLGRKHFWQDEIDLKGKIILVTGATSGIGRSASELFAKNGAQLILVARNQARLEEFSEKLHQKYSSIVQVYKCDLSEPKLVRSLAKKICKTYQRIDVLVNNAGSMYEDKRLNSLDQEMSFATNVLSGFILSNQLIPLLHNSGSGRIIHVSSGGMYLHHLEPDDLFFKRRKYTDLAAYAQSKRAQVILNELLAEKLKGLKVVSECMHPGWVDTPGLKDSMPRFAKVMSPVLREPSQGADTILWLAGRHLENFECGQFWFDRQPRQTHLSNKTKNTMPERQALWHFCVQQSGCDFPYELLDRLKRENPIEPNSSERNHP